jgi:NAD(P)-dependent dehydrogenase (short-subunit alcohol dehydrogenase family)
MRLAGKVAIITGAGAGIGRATALLFAKEGAKVVIADCDSESGAETVGIIRDDEGEATFVQVDVSKAADAERMARKTVETYGKLDILVNNAGIYMEANAVEMMEEDWDRILDVNLKGVFLCSKYCIPEMIKGGGGAVVNIGSEAGIVGIKNIMSGSIVSARAGP